MENTQQGTRKKYAKEFKLEAVRMLEAADRSGKQIEKDLGDGRGQIHKWHQEFAASGERAFPGNGTLWDEELVRLRKEVASLREDCEVLRKVVAMLSRPPR